MQTALRFFIGFTSGGLLQRFPLYLAGYIFCMFSSKALGVVCEFDFDKDYSLAVSVFAGEVISVDDLIQKDPYNTGGAGFVVHQRVRFRVNTVWKGNPREEKFVYFRQDYLTGSWDRIIPGETWLIFTRARVFAGVSSDDNYWPGVDEYYDICLGGGYMQFAENIGYFNRLPEISPLYSREATIFTDDRFYRISAKWLWLEWMGPLYDAGDGWIFSMSLGWLYILPGQNSSNLWIYHFGLNEVDGWIWTSSSRFPWIWRTSDRNWLYVDNVNGSFWPGMQRYSWNTRAWEVFYNSPWFHLDNPQRGD